MIFTLAVVAGAFVGGGIVGAGSFTLFKAKAVSEAKVLLADAKTELAKVSPSITTVVSKIEATIAKL